MRLLLTAAIAGLACLALIGILPGTATALVCITLLAIRD